MAKVRKTKVKISAEQAARQAERECRLARLQEAIDQGRATLDTAFGVHLVKGYNDRTGDCVTVPAANPDMWMHRRTFLVCLDAIKIN
jgi:hypothetical protein